MELEEKFAVTVDYQGKTHPLEVTALAEGSNTFESRFEVNTEPDPIVLFMNEGGDWTTDTPNIDAEFVQLIGHAIEDYYD